MITKKFKNVCIVSLCFLLLVSGGIYSFMDKEGIIDRFPYYISDFLSIDGFKYCSNKPYSSCDNTDDSAYSTELCKEERKIELESDYCLNNHAISYFIDNDFIKMRVKFEKACSLLKPYSCYNLGIVYRDGIGVIVNTDKTIDYFKKSCEMGEQKGCDIANKMIRNKS